MSQRILQKTADELPIEILNPIQAAKQYSLHLYKPSAKLALFVDHYWVMRWDLRSRQSFTCEVIPSPYINLTFMPEGSRITGVTTGKYTYEVKGAGAIFGAKFHPGGFYPYWRQSVSDLTDKAIPASAVFPEADERLNTAITSASKDEDGVKRVETLLLEKIPPADKNTRLILDIITWIKEHDTQTVQSITRHFDLKERTLQELFQTYVGVGLKWIILRSRLQKAARLAAKAESPNWTKIATDLGYSDQAHFVNDFKKIVGKPPAKYASAVRE